ncbi:alpha/beta hydrolase [Aquabacterium sp.]|uniref:alpha/beta fold hydrolase n=1 Tax=Aquabacterium sp. TaxID=1872578 RepID=UPI00248707EB|nr:alpha/beta hydrolase [Aquabacterium sp.]MDI1259130.1 alpha/beta hydrolase [Aquabacterium sp.]
MSSLKTIHLPQGPLQYLDQGRGQPIVFVHGLLADHQLWLPLLPDLGQGVRCIFPNWPLGAHAKAMKPDADLSVPGVARLIADFIAALDLRDVTLVGNDSGGALVQMVCARHPERIGRAVLTTCDAYDVFPPPAFATLKWWGHVPGLAWVSAQLLHHVPVLRRLPIAFGDLTEGPLADDLIEHWLQPLRKDAGVRRDVRKFLRSVSTRFTEEAGFALQGFNRPVLLLWSTRCRHFPKRLAERLLSELPHAELQWVDSAGVFLSLEHAGQVADNIRRFHQENALQEQPEGKSCAI